MWPELIKSFVLLFIIIDPFISAVVFINYSKKSDEKEKNRAIWTAILVAAGLLFIFLFSGMFLLTVLGINFNSFKIAGGIILLILGVTSVLGIALNKNKGDVKSAAILIGTPLLSGPGALTTIIILSREYGYAIPAIAAFMVIVLSYIILKYSYLIEKVISSEIIEILSKVLGLLLASLAVDFIQQGISGFIAGI